MAIGDVVTNWSSVATGAFLVAQPGAGVEWVLFNFMGEAEFEVWRDDGTNAKLVVPAGAATTPAILSNLSFMATNGVFWKLKNVNAGTKFLGYEGRVTK